MANIAPPGLIPAPPPPPVPYGLFSVALGPMPMPFPEAEGGGIQYVPDTCEDDIFMYAINCPPVSGSKTFSTVESAVSGAPFACVVSYTCGSIGFSFEEVEQRLNTRMMLHEQRAVERRVWQGWNLSNGLGSQPGLLSSAVDVGTTACVREAVAKLEQALADNAVVGGMIHARPYMAAHMLDSHLLYKERNVWYTGVGTPVVFGQGYDGSIPNGSPAASGATAEAMYASGRIQVWSSPIAIPPIGQTMNRATNQITALGEKVYVATLECGAWYSTVTRTCTS